MRHHSSVVDVAFFLPNLQVGGAERVMSQLAAGFAGRGLAVDFVLVRAQGPFLAQLPAQVRVVDLNLSSTYYSLPALSRYLRQAHPQVLISALDLTNLMALFARRISGAPVRLAIRLDNTISIQRRSFGKKKIEQILLTRFYPWADEIIAVANFVAMDFAQYTGITIERVDTIYNPILLPDLKQRSLEPLDHPWFAPGEPPVILGVGRLAYQKNFDLLIRAFQIVAQTSNARLLILGEGGDRQALEDLVRSIGLENRIALPGNVANPFAYMSRSTVFVLSSRHEGLPTVLVEAMACGCPVISTNCPGGSAEVLRDGEFGYLTPVDNATALAEAILDVLGKGNRRAPASWLRQFELETVVDQYLRLLNLDHLLPRSE